MTKKLITRVQELHITYFSIEEIINIFNEAKSKLPTNSYTGSEVMYEEKYGSTRVVLQIKYCTPQTEDEARAEKTQELAKLEWKRKQLAALKKELGE